LIEFTKYQGTGNDFILIDDRNQSFPAAQAEQIAYLCDRRFGIGADGLILLQNDERSDFKMVYFNADGHEGSMCGNGGRCTVKFAHELGLISGRTEFRAVDGLHHAELVSQGVALHMNDVSSISTLDTNFVLDTGSPHLVRFVDQLHEFDVVGEGRGIRYSPAYRQDGINVNFVVDHGDFLEIRTYERGVEDETLSCGTGATAAALVWAQQNNRTEGPVALRFPGGEVQVNWRKEEDLFTDIQLIGPAEETFKGTVKW
jgi:diaminopimelate epimerase